jgi:hypothetical protein
MAAWFISMDLESYRLQSPCEAGLSEVMAACDLDEPENLPLHPLADGRPAAEPRPIYALLPSEGMGDPDMEVEHPPPRMIEA